MRLTLLASTLALPLVLTLLAACSEPPAPEEPVRAVRTLTVTPGSLDRRHEYAADIRARTESRLSFQMPGKLVSRTASVGQQVRPGQVLARLDGRDVVVGQDAAQAQLGAAEAQLALTETEFQKFKDLRAQGFISALELERRETALRSARATVEQARARTRSQGNQAGYLVLRADVAGVVTAIEAEPGMVMAAGQTVLQMAHDGARDAVFQVPEDRIDAVRALQGKAGALQIKLWGDRDERSPATVREIAAAADPASRTFLVKADLGAAPVSLGQTATVYVTETADDAVIKLPIQSVFAHNGGSAVWLVDRASMTVRQQPVKVGGAENNLMVIEGGLKTGDIVVTAGVHTLNPGETVRFYTPEAPRAKASGAAPATPAAPAAPAASR